MALASVVLFRTNSIPAGYAVVPLLGLTALRYSARELSFAAVVVASSLTAATANGRGPWAADTTTGAQAHLLEQQVFLLVAILGAWLLKLEVRERVYAVRAAQLAESQLAQATERARQQRHLAGMHEALTELAGAATTAEVAAATVRHGGTLFDADSVALLLEDPAGEELQRLAGGYATVPPDGADSEPSLAAATLEQAIATGQPSFEGEAAAVPPPSGAATSRVAVLPFAVARGRRGALAIARRPGVPWSESAQVRAIAFSSIVADALDRTEQAAVDRQIALTLQQALIPDEMVTPPGVAVAGRYLPASVSLDVGGDWYDLISSPDETSATMIIGDVVGHSLQAAAAMGKLAAAARALAHAGLGPAAMLDVLDRIAEHTPDATMTTMLCAWLCPASGELRYSSAGHPPAALVDPAGGVRLLDGGRGLPLAVPAPSPRRDAVEQVADRSLLCLYTDGLVERRTEPIDLGLARLQRVLAEVDPSDPAAVCDHLTASMIDEDGHDDDVALLCLYLTDAAPPTG
jgi:serine phosphatase RsbU (regulator of sigma subunit)